MIGVIVAVAASPAGHSQAIAQIPVSPPPITPTPGGIGATALPSIIPTSAPSSPPTATPAPRRGRRGAPAATASPGGQAPASPTATPTSPAFSSLDGGWEVELQKIDGTVYSRFTMHQDGSQVSGTWYLGGQQYPFTGSYDGRLFRFIAQEPSGAVNLTGYVENSTDMVGIVDNGKGEVFNVNPLAFTAEHRAPYKATPFGVKGKPKG